MWRACNDILPTKEKLCKRKVVEDHICQLCGQETESCYHALWSCVAARAVWSECPNRINKCNFSAGDFLTLFGMLSKRFDVEEMEIIAVVVQRIWFQRNRYIFEGKMTSPSCLIKGAKETVEEYHQFQALVPQLAQNNLQTGSIVWCAPSDGVIKLNWDIAMNKRLRMVGVGIVARDSGGKVVASKCFIQRYMSDAAIAEAFGACQAASFGRWLGLSSVWLEGDALDIIMALGREEDDEGKYGNFLVETRVILKHFLSFTVGHVRSEGNFAAHLLAKLAVSHQLNQVWFNSFPPCILGVVSSQSVVS